jgi:hypothetical protein
MWRIVGGVVDAGVLLRCCVRRYYAHLACVDWCGAACTLLVWVLCGCVQALLLRRSFEGALESESESESDLQVKFGYLPVSEWLE